MKIGTPAFTGVTDVRQVRVLENEGKTVVARPALGQPAAAHARSTAGEQRVHGTMSWQKCTVASQ